MHDVARTAEGREYYLDDCPQEHGFICVASPEGHYWYHRATGNVRHTRPGAQGGRPPPMLTPPKSGGMSRTSSTSATRHDIDTERHRREEAQAEAIALASEVRAPKRVLVLAAC